jgi:hypothetical protein
MLSISILAGCSSGDDTAAAGSTSGGGCTNDDPRAPAECCGANPDPAIMQLGRTPEDAACTRALAKICQEQTTETGCRATSALYFSCGWARFVTFEDTFSCPVANVRESCEAYFPWDGFGSGTLCANDPPPGNPGSWVAIPGRNQLASELGFSGPLGLVPDVESCGGDPQPDVCDCLDAACALE